MKLVCKLLGFILALFVATVDGVGYALKTVGTVLVDTVGGIVGAAGDALLDSGVGSWIILGLGAWFLVSVIDKKRESGTTIRVAEAQSEGSYASQ